MPNTALNRTTQTLMTNKSGGSVAYGAVVVVDTTTDSSFTTTTTSGIATTQVGVVLEPNGIANNALGMVAVGGWAPKCTLNTAATRGQFIKSHTVAGQGTPHSAPQQEGDFAVALEASATPAISLFGSPNGPTSGTGTVTHTGTLTANAVVIGNGTADVTVLAALGASGTVLTSAGAGAPPAFTALPSAGALVLLEQHTASSSATLDFTSCISSTYDDYQVEVLEIVPGTTATNLLLQFSTNGGSSYDTGSNYAWAHPIQFTDAGSAFNGNTNDSATGISMFGTNPGMNTGTGRAGHASFRLHGLLSSSVYKVAHGTFIAAASNGVFGGGAHIGVWKSQTAVNAFRFIPSSGNIASGTIRVYGIAK